MKKVFFVLSFILIALSSVNAQKTVSDFKYVIVPERYDFLKQSDQYKLNSLTKFLLEKENLEVYFDNSNIPTDLAENRCLALHTKVTDYSKLFKTKLKIELLDCYNNVIVASEIGETREKEHKVAYHEALRNAYESIKGLNYSYAPSNEVTEIKKDVKISDKPEIAIVVPPKKVKSTPEPVKIKEVKEVQKPKAKVVVAPVPIAVSKTPEKKPVVKIEEPVVEKKSQDVLFAQPIANGFQLVDMSPKVVMVLLSTSLQDVYIVKGQDAIVFKKDGKWYHSIDSKSSQELNIKF